MLNACIVEEEGPTGLPPAEPVEMPEYDDDLPEQDVPCDEGDEMECKVDLPTTEGGANCFVGMTYCVEGSWTPCGDPIK